MRFFISKRAVEFSGTAYEKELLKKLFPFVSLLGGWDSITLKHEKWLFALTRFDQLKQQNKDLRSRDLEATLSVVGPYHLNYSAKITWPAELGDFNLNPYVEENSLTYSISSFTKDQFEKIKIAIQIIGVFAETRDYNHPVIPIGKVYDPDLTELFPASLLSGWKSLYDDEPMYYKYVIDARRAHENNKESYVYINSYGDPCIMIIGSPYPLIGLGNYGGSGGWEISNKVSYDELKSLAPTIIKNIESISLRE